ncbi:hypothetical protein B0H17DRAFT_1150347 [Mycena rosella]|uniref:Uncharacterized protein n=1 Tax=Mycena rosella TaxID=1033263 RepID=A0AAD7BT51_MYCRO|nr:hypothetical protein B0H17DRAFT_1150347 [Mycena rosella]
MRTGRYFHSARAVAHAAVPIEGVKMGAGGVEAALRVKVVEHAWVFEAIQPSVSNLCKPPLGPRAGSENKDNIAIVRFSWISNKMFQIMKVTKEIRPLVEDVVAEYIPAPRAHRYRHASDAPTACRARREARTCAASCACRRCACAAALGLVPALSKCSKREPTATPRHLVRFKARGAAKTALECGRRPVLLALPALSKRLARSPIRGVRTSQPKCGRRCMRCSRPRTGGRRRCIDSPPAPATPHVPSLALASRITPARVPFEMMIEMSFTVQYQVELAALATAEQAFEPY